MDTNDSEYTALAIAKDRALAPLGHQLRSRVNSVDLSKSSERPFATAPRPVEIPPGRNVPDEHAVDIAVEIFALARMGIINGPNTRVFGAAFVDLLNNAFCDVDEEDITLDALLSLPLGGSRIRNSRDAPELFRVDRNISLSRARTQALFSSN